MYLENFQIIKSSLKQYIGNGVYQVLILLCLIYICVREKDKKKRVLLFYFPIMVLFIILNPMFHKYLGSFLSENVYWRTFWMIPLGLILAYTSTSIIKSVPDITKKIILFVLLAFIIILSGSFVYTKDNYLKCYNWYKIPDEYLEVINTISDLELENKKVMLPTDLMLYVRQVDANIKLAYERIPTEDYNSCDIVKYYDSADISNLIQLCQEKKVNIIIYSKDAELSEPLSNYGYELCKQVGKYDIYILEKR